MRGLSLKARSKALSLRRYGGTSNRRLHYPPMTNRYARKRHIQPWALGFLSGALTAHLVRWTASAARAGTVRDGTATFETTATAGGDDEGFRADGINRGRDAQRPGQIPARGWKGILVRTCREFNEDQIALIAAGCTFYSLLALFPAVTAFAALYGLFADVGDAQAHIRAMSGVLPAGAIDLIGDQMVKVTAAGETGLSFAFVAGVLTALWSANKAMKAIVTGLNIAYEEAETRSFVAKTLTPLAFTIGLVVFAMAAIGFAAAGAGLTANAAPFAQIVWTVFYWSVLFSGVVLGMTLLYRFGPSRRRARWRWVTWGSGLAALAWLAMSGAFTFYVSRFGNYDEAYGALGAAIGFMTWTWLSSMVFLMGAELNAEIEHQTAVDSTTGAPRPLGARGAVMADTLGEAV